eukprot:scaffold6358_cov267-Pinguiococcus_pyrenoidosus.AAC.9
MQQILRLRSRASVRLMHFQCVYETSEVCAETRVGRGWRMPSTVVQSLTRRLADEDQFRLSDEVSLVFIRLCLCIGQELSHKDSVLWRYLPCFAWRYNPFACCERVAWSRSEGVPELGNVQAVACFGPRGSTSS